MVAMTVQKKAASKAFTKVDWREALMDEMQDTRLATKRVVNLAVTSVAL